MNLVLPFNKDFIEELNTLYPTPFYIYEESQIRATAHLLTREMEQASVPGFRNFFAVKALPNPQVLSILKDEGMGVDCSSLAELELASRAGFMGKDIMFTSNNTTLPDFRRAHDLGAIINFDDLSLLRPYLGALGSPKIACCRYNPGDIEFDGINEQIIGKPSQAKFGMTKPQIIEAYRQLKSAGVKQFGLHTMLLSNELDYRNHERIADLLFALAAFVLNL
jgi:diaminopimelate decarboxylase